MARSHVVSSAAILFGAISERFYVLLAALEKKILSFTSVVKQKPEMSDEVEIFLRYVLDRSQEINDNIHQENRGDCEYFLSEMLLHLENTKVPANVVLVSMDVTSLYTNIPQEEGIRHGMQSIRNIL